MASRGDQRGWPRWTTQTDGQWIEKTCWRLRAPAALVLDAGFFKNRMLLTTGNGTVSFESVRHGRQKSLGSPMLQMPWSPPASLPLYQLPRTGPRSLWVAERPAATCSEIGPASQLGCSAQQRWSLAGATLRIAPSGPLQGPEVRRAPPGSGT